MDLAHSVRVKLSFGEKDSFASAIAVPFLWAVLPMEHLKLESRHVESAEEEHSVKVEAVLAAPVTINRTHLWLGW